MSPAQPEEREAFESAAKRFAETLSRDDAERLIRRAEEYQRRDPPAAAGSRAADAADEARQRLRSEGDATYASEAAVGEMMVAFASGAETRARRRRRERMERLAASAPEPAIRDAFRLALGRHSAAGYSWPPEGATDAARAAFLSAEVAVAHSRAAAEELAADDALRVAHLSERDQRVAAARLDPGYGRRIAGARRAAILAAIPDPRRRAEIVRLVAQEVRYVRDRDVGCPLSVLLATLAASEPFAAARAALEARVAAIGDPREEAFLRSAHAADWPEEAECARAERHGRALAAFLRRRDRESAERVVETGRPWHPAVQAARERLGATDLAAYAEGVAERYRARLGDDEALEELRALEEEAFDRPVAEAARRVLVEAYEAERDAYRERLAECLPRIAEGASAEAARECLALREDFRARWPDHDGMEDEAEEEAVRAALARACVGDDEAAGALAARLLGADADAGAGAPPFDAVHRARRALGVATEPSVRSALEKLLEGEYRRELAAWRHGVGRFLAAQSLEAARRLCDLFPRFCERWPRHEPDDRERKAVAAASTRAASGGDEEYARRLVRSLRAAEAAEGEALGLADAEADPGGPVARAMRALARELALEGHASELADLAGLDPSREGARRIVEAHAAFAAARAAEWGGEEPPLPERAARALRLARLRASVDDGAWADSGACRRRGAAESAVRGLYARERAAWEAEALRLGRAAYLGLSRPLSAALLEAHGRFAERWGPEWAPDRGESAALAPLLEEARRRAADRSPDERTAGYLYDFFRERAALGGDARARVERMAREVAHYATEPAFREAAVRFLSSPRS